MSEWRLKCGMNLGPVDNLCPACEGTGIRMYPNLATWRSKPGGISCNAMSRDVCDSCWGSGDADHPWLNLKVNEVRMDAAKKLCMIYCEIAEAAIGTDEVVRLRDAKIEEALPEGE